MAQSKKYETFSDKFPGVKVPTVLPALQAVRIVGVAAHSEHNLALSEAGRVYSWGSGGYGALGHGDGKNQHAPKLIEALQAERVVRVAAGSCQSLAVTQAGHVFEWGASALFPVRALLPTLVALPAVIAEVSAGNSSCSFALSEEGRIYSWGRWSSVTVGDKCGVLGHGDDEDQLEPKLIEALKTEKMVRISCYAGHCLALSEAGHVYSWGDGDDGMLGHGDDEGLYGYIPKLIEALQAVKVVGVSVGDTHSIAVTEGGEVYSWGHGGSGQLGHGDTETQHIPKRVEALQTIKVVSAYAIAFSSLAVDDRGAAWGWGSREEVFLHLHLKDSQKLPLPYPPSVLQL